MSTHFIGINKLTKFSKKLGVMFCKGYLHKIRYNKPKSYKIYLLSDSENISYALLEIQDAKNEERKYKLRKLQKNFNILSDDCDIDIDYQKDDIFLRTMPFYIDLTQYIKAKMQEKSIYGGIINENYTVEQDKE